MSVQPHDTDHHGESGIPVLTLPRTLRAVRGALSDAERLAFAAELEESNDVIETFGRWWSIAAVRTSPEVAAGVERYRRGAPTISLEDLAARFRRSA